MGTCSMRADLTKDHTCRYVLQVVCVVHVTMKGRWLYTRRDMYVDGSLHTTHMYGNVYPQAYHAQRFEQPS